MINAGDFCLRRNHAAQRIDPLAIQPYLDYDLKND